MKELFGKILQTKTIKHSAITFTGTFLTGVLGAVFYILMARFLGPADFGIFSVSVLALTLIADVANVGVNTGILRFVGKYFSENGEKALRFLKLGFETKALLSIALLLLGWLLVPFVARNLFAKEEFITPLRLSLLGVAGVMLFSFVTSSFDALQKYFTSNSLSVGTNALRLVFVILLFISGLLTVNSSLIAYSAVPIIGAVAGLIFLPRFLQVSEESEVAKEFFSYNKWVAVFTAIAALSSRLDSFISTRLLTLEEVGIYSVAVSLSSIVPQVVFALGVVAAPKLASFDSKQKAFSYLKKLQLFVLGLAGAGLLVGVPLSYWLIPTFYGAAYINSIAPFVILLIAQAIFLISTPTHTGVIYYFGYPKLFVWISLVHLAIIGALGWVLIRRFGMMGAATTVLVGTVSNFVIPAVWILKKFSK